ncbi:hypothetical protein NMG60_11006297 [Bertholletia excelsa]
MGALCCCMREDYEDHAYHNRSVYENCVSLWCFLQNFLHVHTSLFQRDEEHAISSSIQGTSSLTSTAFHDNSLSDSYHSFSRPLPCDANPQCFPLLLEGMVSSHSHEQIEPLRSDSNVDSASLNTEDKWNGSICKEKSKVYQTRSSLKLSTAIEYAHTYFHSEDEDVCPTCLEEYTPENPKIITKCSHHFHLGCIYEWMERSENCPVCGKVMAFDETT